MTQDPPQSWPDGPGHREQFSIDPLTGEPIEAPPPPPVEGGPSPEPYPTPPAYPAYPPPYGYYPPPPGYPPPGWAVPRPTNGLAIASMILGILWIYWIGSILALVFGLVARSQIRRTGEGGDGMAVAGIVLGGIGCATLALVLVGVLGSLR